VDREVVAGLVAEAGVDQPAVVVVQDPGGGGLLVAEETEDKSRIEPELVDSTMRS